MLFRKQSEHVFSPLRDLQHVAFSMNGLPEFICFAGFKLHRIVADGAEQVVRHLSVSLLTKSSSGRLYPGDEGHWFSLSYFRDFLYFSSWAAKRTMGGFSQRYETLDESFCPSVE
jgi:hypothetical protein